MNSLVKPLVVSCFLSFSMSVFAMCPSALPAYSSDFCASFKVAAVCHCTETWGLPKGMCQDMNKLYSRMMASLGTLKRVCEYQHDTSTQECMDDWNCYRSGGMTSDGQLCSGTGQACA